MQTITLEEAQARLLEVVHCVMSEKVELLRSIDRILAEDVYAHVSQPPFERSAMDGYAVRSEDIRTVSRSNPVCLKVIDRVCAGEVTDKSAHAGEAIRIMTGAMIPEGADQTGGHGLWSGTGQNLCVIGSKNELLSRRRGLSPGRLPWMGRGKSRCLYDGFHGIRRNRQCSGEKESPCGGDYNR